MITKKIEIRENSTKVNNLKEYISDPKSFNDSLLRITSDRKQYERYIYMYTKPLLLIL